MTDILVEDRFLSALENPGQWQNVRIVDAFSTKDLEQIRRLLQKARAILDVFDDILDAVGAFTAILRALESFINDVLIAALLALTNALEDAVNQFKSTGVYALDLITPFVNAGDVDALGDFCDDQSINDTSDIFNIRKLAKNDFNKGAARFFKRQTYEEFIEIIAEAFLDENDLPSPYIAQTFLKKLNPVTENTSKNKDLADSIGLTDKIQDAAFKDIFRPGRPNFGPGGKLKFYLLTISAFDFLQYLQILLSFSRFFGNILGNHESVKELILRAQAYYYCLTRKYSIEANEIFSEKERAYKQELSSIDFELLGYEEVRSRTGSIIEYLNGGAKNSSATNPNSAYTSLIVSVQQLEEFLNANDIELGDLSRAYVGVVTSIKDAVIAKAENTNISRATQLLDSINTKQRELENIITNATVKFSQKNTAQDKITRLNSERQNNVQSVSNFKNDVKGNPLIGQVCNADGFIDEQALYKRKRFNSGTRDSIDFYGLSAYQLFPDLFDFIEELLQKIRSYAKPVATGISDLIDNIIRAIREEIDNLRQIINIIEQILQFIEDFLNLNGISMLALDTNQGTYGLVTQLRRATGFNGANTGKRMYIAGIMVGVGYPDVTDSENGVFANVGAVFEMQKAAIEGGASNLETVTNAGIGNAENAFNKFGQFFK